MSMAQREYDDFAPSIKLPEHDQQGHHFTSWRSPRVIVRCGYCKKFTAIQSWKYRTDKTFYCKASHRGRKT